MRRLRHAGPKALSASCRARVKDGEARGALPLQLWTDRAAQAHVALRGEARRVLQQIEEHLPKGGAREGGVVGVVAAVVVVAAAETAAAAAMAVRAAVVAVVVAPAAAGGDVACVSIIWSTST